MSEFIGAVPRGEEHTLLLRGKVHDQERHLVLHPYPSRGNAAQPERRGFPSRPRVENTRTEQEELAQQALKRMNEVLARLQEVEEALDDPANVWPRLRQAWNRAENEEDPRMAEIVRQAGEIMPLLKDLQRRMRRVLRRTRESTPLDRVQEMDRSSMLWLVRQPGRNVAERAGGRQRILATVRQDNFDTLENRVLHAYVRLATDRCRAWLREHPRANGSTRYEQVKAFHSTCRNFVQLVAECGIGVAERGVTPNYVLMQAAMYSVIYEAWLRLIDQERAIDDLWAWQAQTWTDFAALAIVLALDELDEAQLVAQAPIVWRGEASVGRWFDHDRPLAVFWLRESGLIVEVQSRPESPSTLQTRSRAHIFLRISHPNSSELPLRIAVWTPHAMQRLDLQQSVEDASDFILELQQGSASEVMRNGLILTPGHGTAELQVAQRNRVRVDGIAFDASGNSLREGLNSIRSFVRGEIFRGVA